MSSPPWQFVVLLLAACVIVPLAIIVWRNWDVPAARPFALALVLCSGWCIIAAIEVSTTSLSDKILLFRLRLSFLPFIPPLLLEAFYRYAKGRRLLYGWRLLLILVIPLASAMLAWFPGRLFGYDFHLGHTAEFTTLIFSRGPAFVIYYLYCTGLAVYALILMGATWRHSPRWMRRGTLLFLVVYMLPATTDFLFVTGWSPTPEFNYTPLVYAVSASLLAWILFGERILNLGPVARSVLIEHLKDLLIVLDAGNYVIDTNKAAAEKLQVDPESSLGRPATDILADWPDVLSLIDQGAVENREVRLGANPDVWECSIYPVPEKSKEHPHARIILLRNITERKQIEEELLRAKDAAESSNRAKSTFLAMVSHEVRTPMGGVLGFAQLLEQTPLNPEQKSYVDLILSSGEAQLRIINDILDYSKVEAGRMELEQRPFQLKREIENSCQLLLPEAQKKNISLCWEMSEDLPETVVGDSLRVSQILVNLISNAVKFTSEGAVTVRADCETFADKRCRIRLLVSDTGIGIAPEAFPLLFQSFSQVENSTARRFGGTGLGLSIAKKLCQLMHGDITFESTRGKGSTFEATFILSTATAPATPSESYAPTNTDGPVLDILVVEDNSINQRLIQAMLQKMGHRVVLCADGKSALSTLGERSFDAIFMDIEMPEKDGFETTAEIRRMEDRGLIPGGNHIIALTAHAIPGIRERCLAAGMNGCVTKPFDFRALRNVLAAR